MIYPNKLLIQFPDVFVIVTFFTLIPIILHSPIWWYHHLSNLSPMIKIYNTAIIILQNDTKFIKIGQFKENSLVWDSFLSLNTDFLYLFGEVLKTGVFGEVQIKKIASNTIW